MDESKIELLVKRIVEQQTKGSTTVNSEDKKDSSSLVKANSSNTTDKQTTNNTKLTVEDYPLQQKQPQKVISFSGKSMNDITIDKVVKEQIGPDDIKISAEVLELQAQIAESNGKKQFAANLRRAAEMTRIPDDKVLQVYELLRPRRATKQQLLEVANELETKYAAQNTAQLIRDAAETYEKRKVLIAFEK